MSASSHDTEKEGAAPAGLEPRRRLGSLAPAGFSCAALLTPGARGTGPALPMQQGKMTPKVDGLDSLSSATLPSADPVAHELPAPGAGGFSLPDAPQAFSRAALFQRAGV